MATTSDPDVLHDRARNLRALARRLDASPITTLAAAAGDDTWRGPTADAFRADARRAERIVAAAADDLRAAARALEQAARDRPGTR